MTPYKVKASRAAGSALAVSLLALHLPSSAHAQPAAQASASADSIGAEALRAAASSSDVQAFYEQNGWKAVWTRDASAALASVLKNRAKHGLDKVTFLEDFPAQASPAQKEVARTRAALAYAAALAKGRVDPNSLREVYTIPRPDPDLAGGLAKAISKGDLASWFASLAPQDGDYARLSKAYATYADEPQGADAIADSGLIHVGDQDKRVPTIVQQLRQGEYLSRDDATSDSGADEHGGPPSVAPAAGGTPDVPDRYTQEIADAVERLQRDYGIAADGVVGPDTLAVLNLRPGDRARALAVAMERLRWLSRDPPATRIDVNTAAARLEYFRDGKMVDTRRVIVGQPGKETPPLRAPIYRLVANPTWTVPKSIENSEMSDVGSSYLKDHNMVRRDGYIVQLSGPDNALGLVKFDMRDDQAIYLHDTSAPSLFERSQRHLSHGCVRVEDALGFAKMIAKDEGVTAAWTKAHAASDQTFVDLPHEIPVRLLYQNVFVDHDGEIAFRTDPYGWNAPIAKALGFKNASDARAHADAIDIGP